MNRKSFRLVLSFVLTICLIFTNFAGISTFEIVKYAEASTTLANGDIEYSSSEVCSEGKVTAILSKNSESENETYTLTIEGQGKMNDFKNKKRPPWYRDGKYKKITSIQIKDGVTYIGNYAFLGISLDEELVIPASVESIGNKATSAKKVKILGMNTTFTTDSSIFPFSMGNGKDQESGVFTCFEGSAAESLFKTMKVGFSWIEVTVNPCFTYSDEENTTTSSYQATSANLTIPDSVTTIGENTFKDNTRLTSVDLNNVTSINAGAFSGCTNLKSIVVTSKVTRIEKDAFSTGTTICGKNGSAAQDYAKANNLIFVNLLPVLKDGVSATVDKTVTNVGGDEIDLSQVFTNAYGSDMTYLVSEDNSEYKAVQGSKYTFLKSDNGQHKVTFKAKDSAGDTSEQTYTVNYTVRSNTEPTIKTDVKSEQHAFILKDKTTFNLSDIFDDADGDTLKYYLSVNGETAKEVQAPYEYKYNSKSSTGPMTLSFTANDGFADSEKYTVTAYVYDFSLIPVAGADVEDVSGAVCTVTDSDNNFVVGTKFEGAYYYFLEKGKQYKYEVTTDGCVTMQDTFTYDGRGKRTEVKISKKKHRLPTTVVDICSVKGLYAYGQGMTDEEKEKAWNTVLIGTTAWSKYVGLGGFGGYMTVYYEDGIVDDPTNPYGIDFIVYGNAFAYGNTSGGEPAGVKVSEDGVTWYELAGSAHYEVSTKYAQSATTLDGKATTSTLIAKQGEYKIDGVVPESLTPFGYADVHMCSGEKNAEGEYKVTGVAGNPYSSTHKENIGDGFDLEWAVDENGKPVDVSGKTFHYIRMQNVVDITHPTFGTNSTEIGTLNRAVASSNEVGVTSTPQSIKIQGKEYISETPTTTVDDGNTKYYEVNLDDTSIDALEVEVTGNSGDNIYVNKERFDEKASYKGLLKADGSRVVRVIVQNGEKEPLIYVFSFTGGGNPEENADLQSISLTPGETTIKSPSTSEENVFSVANNVEKITFTPSTLNSYAKIELYKENEEEPIELESDTSSNVLPLNVGKNCFKFKVTSADNTVSNEYTVTVNRTASSAVDTNSIKVSFAFTGDVIHYSSSTGTNTGNHSANTWIKTTTVTIPKNSTVKYITDLMLYNNGIEFEATHGGTYISRVKIPNTNIWLGEYDNGENSGWMYRLNGLIADEGYATRVLKSGDTIVWFYTDDYTKETGYEGGWDVVNSGSTETVDKVTTSGATGSATTTTPTETKVTEKTAADGTKEKVATVTVSSSNQKELLKQAKANKSKEIVLQVSKDSVKDASKAEVQLDKSFVNSILNDTDATVTVETPLGNKTYTQAELKELAASATGSTITLTVDKSDATVDTTDELDVKAEVAKLTPVARSSKTAKRNIKVTTSLDKNDKAIIAELKDAGYTVKYRFYRSTKKAASYKSALTKKTSSYVNTSGKAGTRYYYKVQIRVYDKDGKLVAKTALKQCKYATRKF